MGTRKQPKTKAKKPDSAASAKSPNPKVARSKASAGSTVTARADIEDLGELRIAMIARAAYLRAEQRGFEPGKELDDWLAAAAEIDAQLERRGGA